jgi:hypothetical protein
MKDKKHNFSEYMNNSKTLFKMLFGEKLFNKLDSTPLKNIDWNGIDVDCCEITATFPNIKDRFNKEWIEYFSEREGTLLDLYLQTIFHYGYQQCYDKNKNVWDKIESFLSKPKIEEQK